MQTHELNIGNFAQPCVATIDPKAPARVALSFMEKAGIHYLPVQTGKKVVGVISDNRLRTALAFHRAKKFSVSDLMFKKPTVVSPETSLYQVLDETPDSTHGFTVIQNSSGEVTGFFTPNDAISAFRHMLRSDSKDSQVVAA